MSVMIKTLSAVAVISCMVGTAHAGPFAIGGNSYTETGPPESVTALFTQPDGGVSVGTYSGLVKLKVSGTGQSLGANFNDAFYVYANSLGNPIAPFNEAAPGYYQLTMGTGPLVPLLPAQNARNFIVYDIDAALDVSPPPSIYVPGYRADHTYSFIVDLSLIGGVLPSTLHFGTGNGVFGDNTGSHTIEVTQLSKVTPGTTGVPDSGTTLVLFATGMAGLAGAARRLRRRS